jgi:hypothetical protein
MNDLESRLRHDAARLPPTAGADLAERVLAAVGKSTRAPLAGDFRSRRPVAMALGAGIAAVVVAAVAVGRTPSRPSAPEAGDRSLVATPIALPAIDVPAAWRLSRVDPLGGELAMLRADLRGAGLFLAARLPVSAAARPNDGRARGP